MRFAIHIRVNGLSMLLDYDAFLEYHDASALAGATVAWRAMEQAAILLSDVEIWSRGDLSVSARHDGPGVRDALEYVTRCFTRDRYQRDKPRGRGGPCTSAEDFHFTVNDGRRVVSVALREGAIDEAFFTAAARSREQPDSAEVQALLSRQKLIAAEAVCALRLGELFSCSTTLLVPGGTHA